MKKTVEEIKRILPNSESAEFEEIKNKTPYGVLQDFAEAINETYKDKLSARIGETYRQVEESVQNPVFALYLQAPIGKGYLYRLLEIEQLTAEPYPVYAYVLQDIKGQLGEYKDYSTFYDGLLKFFKSNLVSTIILNMIGQVELYNESRKK